jgi:putative endonuclease
MLKSQREQTAKPSIDSWSVYMVRCADRSLYTGITRDVTRRCQQHNAGTASRYTRSRLPVELVYHEAHHTQSSALKREAVIKTMDRQEKLTMTQQRKKPAKVARQVARLEDQGNRIKMGDLGRPAGQPGGLSKG